MPLSRETLEKRAVTSGIKASKKRHHLVSEAELLALRIQVMPWMWRAFLIVLGTGLIAACWFGWPSRSGEIRALEGIGGVFSLLFGAFGVRKTLSNVLDSTSSLEGIGDILELIADAVTNIDL